MRFGLMFFEAAGVNTPASEVYQTVCAASRLADEGGLSAVWTPERHFDHFGGAFPNPALTGAAVAVSTRHIQVRAGSLISPLHNTIRIAEDWSVLDNLSGGRVAISFGSGWNVNDFVLNPHNYDQRREVMLSQIEQIRRLWRGEEIKAANGVGRIASVKLYPSPVQPELPVWLTSSGDPKTFAAAGSIGANILTHLIGQDLDELSRKIDLYRQARSDHGYPPGEGVVSLMLHTHMDYDAATAVERSRDPFRNYLRSAVALERQAAAGGGTISGGLQLPDEEIPADLIEELLDLTYERYLTSGSLIGSPETCTHFADRVTELGVDEIACLIDFGLPGQDVLAGLPALINFAARFR